MLILIVLALSCHIPFSSLDVRCVPLLGFVRSSVRLLPFFPQAVWRGYVNQQLAGAYATLHAQPDFWLMLQAPSFDDVLRWRTEQEIRLRERTGTSEHAVGLMDDAALARFVQHYERLTRHCLASLPPQMDLVWTLGSDRAINAWAGPLVPR